VLGIHHDLRRQVLAGAIVSAVLGIAGAAALVVATTSRAEPRWALVVFAVAALGVSYLGTVITPRWYRRATRVVASTRPSAAIIVVHREADSESTSLYVELEGSKLPLVMPAWVADLPLDQPVEAQVYRDPSTGDPLAFRIANGLLWRLPGPPDARRSTR
jgi:hypothetical protein